ncbi:MAG TPA: TonB-dependent receptor [Bryobacteraceae bacterium]|nr:TonB-dependent receptor [Bryobacteraceae bacterium]
MHSHQNPALRLSAALVLFLLPAFGQTITTGEITGTVTDPSGAVIAGAAVTLTSPGTGAVRNDTTSTSGVYRFPLVQPGDYVLNISAAGFQTSQIKTTVTLGAAVRVDARLKVATSTETIEINAEATAVQTENADIQNVFTTEQLQMLPNPGNDLTYYAQLSPGAVMNSNGGYGNLSVFGLPGTSNLFTLNGQNDNDPFLNLNNSGATNLLLGSNEMAEVSVTTNGYSAQYGQLAGAQVNYITRSGTNEFHGNANYFWNGRIMNANDWFNNASGEPRAFDNVNQYSASIGGPIWKNHTFFFSDYEGLRALIPLAGTDVRLPSQAFQTAVLNNLAATGNSNESAFYKQAFGAWNSAVGATRATAVPGSSADVQGPGCGDLTVLSPGQACANQYFITPVNFAPEWLWTLRVDQNLGDKDRIYGRFQIDHGTQPTGTDPLNPLFSLISFQPENQQQVSWTHVFGPNATNSFTGSHLYYAAAFGYANLSATNAFFAPQLALNDGSFYTLNSPETYMPQGRDVQQGQIGDDFTWTKGRQTFKFGLNWHRDWVYDFDFQQATQGALWVGTIDDFYAGALGSGGYFYQTFPQKTAENIGVYQLGLYAEDDVKVTKDLAVNFSLRADHNSNPTCQGGCFATSTDPFTSLNYDPTIPYNQVIQTGRGQAYYKTDAIVWGPRVGLAWSVTPKTVIRGGVGIFADSFPAFVVDNFVENPPNYNAFFFLGTPTMPIAPGVSGSAFDIASSGNASLLSGFSSGGTVASLSASNPLFAPPNLYTMDPILHQPRYYEWNLEVQRDIGWHSVFSLNYVGNHGIKEPIDNNGLNAFCYGGCGSGLPIPSAAPDQRFGEVYEYQSSGFSRYDGLVVSLRHSMSNHLAFGINYTWSHATDVVSNGGLEPFSYNGQGSILSEEDPFNIRGYNYGNADYDIRHYLSANYVIDDLFRALHFTRGSNLIFGGWTVSGAVLVHTGFPFSVVQNNALLGNYGGTLFAQPLTAGWSSCGGGAAFTNNSPCLNPNSFAPSMTTSGVLDAFATQSRNQYRGPGFFVTDISVSKVIPIRERLKLGIGVQAFNLFNHPNFGQPQSNIDNPGQFGQIYGLVSEPTSILGSFLGGDASPRLIQLHGTLRF